MNVYLLTLDGVFDTGLAALQDTFSIANELRETCGVATPGILTKRVGIGGTVHTASGLSVPTSTPTELPPPDIAVVPAIGLKTPVALKNALCRTDITRAGTVLRKWRSEGATIAAACTGTFILAEAGLLAGRTSATSWWLGQFFRSRYPDVHLDDDKTIVSSGDIVTAGAILAHFDLALWLIRQSSPALASLVAQHLITDPRSSQATYVIPDQLRHSDPVVERFEQWTRKNLASGFSVKFAADAVGTSTRTLSRRVQKIVGKSPLAYVQDLRVERAIYLLQMTNYGIDDIAEQVGYADSVTLRLLIRKKTGRRVSDIRKS